MPSNLSPRLRWQPASLPILESGLDRLERAHRVICGSLTLWSSRIAGFRWLDHGASEVTYRYCVARINGDRQAPRPTAHQLRACLQEVGESIDAEAYQALHILALSIAAAPPRTVDEQGHATAYDDLAGAPFADSDLVEGGEPPAIASALGLESSDSRFQVDSTLTIGEVGHKASQLRGLLNVKRAERTR